MLKPSIGLSLEGMPIIFLAVFFTLLAALLELPVLVLLGFVLTCLIFNFFRDPERVIPQDTHVAVSPADGKIVKVDTLPDPFTGEEKIAICVFMNVFNVHVNRAPISGKVRAIRYWPGKYFNASLDKASKDNERNAVQIEDEQQNMWSVVQIAGLIARRIICWTEVGDHLKIGQRFGLIKFGSRLDLYLPPDYEPKVCIGDKVFAGQTILAAQKIED